jgi:hypothetical protein
VCRATGVASLSRSLCSSLTPINYIPQGSSIPLMPPSYMGLFTPAIPLLFVHTHTHIHIQAQGVIRRRSSGSKCLCIRSRRREESSSVVYGVRSPHCCSRGRSRVRYDGSSGMRLHSTLQTTPVYKSPFFHSLSLSNLCSLKTLPDTYPTLLTLRRRPPPLSPPTLLRR